MPMHRWMASAAGGTSQRLNPAPAIVRSRARKPGVVRTSAVDMSLAPLSIFGFRSGSLMEPGRVAIAVVRRRRAFSQ